MSPDRPPSRSGRPEETDATGRREQLRFAVVFSVLAVAVSFAYYFPYTAGGFVDAWMSSYLRAYVRCAGAVLSRLDSSVFVSGFDVHGRFPLRVTRDCDGMQVNILFASAVLAFPASWPRRLFGLTVGCALLVVLNLVRLCTLYFIGVYCPGVFDFAHRELWPLLLVAAALTAFVVWARWLQRPAAVPG
jgi:exosortase/archaeosortase family protein